MSNSQSFPEIVFKWWNYLDRGWQATCLGLLLVIIVLLGALSLTKR